MRNFVAKYTNSCYLLKTPDLAVYTLKQISDICSAKLIGRDDQVIKIFLFDSRQFRQNTDAVFIALITERNNGHAYIDTLYKAGLRSFIVTTNQVETHKFPEASFLVVNDTLVALQQLAAFHRKQFQIPVIGITGSNGKTIVKEWLYQCLKSDFSICRSPRSYNSQIGVAISVLNLEAHHTLAIFEAGISKPEEMQQLQAMIQPTIGVFTYLGSAHNEGFVSHEIKLQEKYKLFQNVNVLITREAADKNANLSIPVKLYSETFRGFTEHLPFQDEVSKSNAALCAAVLQYLGYTDKQITERLNALQPVAMRLEMRSAVMGSLLINDFYNSDLDSLRLALHYLRQNSRRKRNCVIISDIEQSGLAPATLYKLVQELLQAEKIDLIIGIGEEITRFKSLFPDTALFYEAVNDFVAAYRSIAQQLAQATILLKGSSRSGFEQISRLLQLKSHDTVFEINLDRLRDNVNYFRSLIQPTTAIMAMVKATAYGSGSAEIAKLLQSMGLQYLAVAYADEGVELREAMVTLPIMVMSPEEEAFDDIIQYQLEPEIYSENLLNRFVAALDRHGITEGFPVHLKIDTGMHRLGFEPFEIAALAERIKLLPQIKIQSVFSHLAASDNSELDAFTQEQISTFTKAYDALVAVLGYKPIRHICNSAAISRFPAAQLDMVRLGIGMYGIGANPKEQSHLQHVGILRSRISQIKVIAENETVGYNRNGKLKNGGKIAVIPIGYADGFSRQLGNGRHGVYINNVFCKTVGNICMDMCMVDITNVNCKTGDEVIIFSNQDQLQALASALNTIPYEVLTSVSGRVKRVYTQE